MSHASEVVSAASLLLAITGWQYNTWRSDVSEALKREPMQNDAQAYRTDIAKVIRERCIPLVVILALSVLAIGAASLPVAFDTCRAIRAKRLNYDGAAGCLLLVLGFAVALLVNAVRNLRTLSGRVQALGPTEKPKRFAATNESKQ